MHLGLEVSKAACVLSRTNLESGVHFLLLHYYGKYILEKKCEWFGWPCSLFKCKGTKGK